MNPDKMLLQLMRSSSKTRFLLKIMLPIARPARKNHALACLKDYSVKKTREPVIILMAKALSNRQQLKLLPSGQTLTLKNPHQQQHNP